MRPTISSLIASAESGDTSAADALFSALYRDLHDLARRQLSRSAPEMTLGTTTLLHEAYLDMARLEGAVFPDRGRFMGYAAKVMRGLIIDHVRNRKAIKRGGAVPHLLARGRRRVPQRRRERSCRGSARPSTSWARSSRSWRSIVDLKFFCGFSFIEIAAMRSLNERTVRRSWEKARIYLHGLIQDED